MNSSTWVRKVILGGSVALLSVGSYGAEPGVIDRADRAISKVDQNTQSMRAVTECGEKTLSALKINPRLTEGLAHNAKTLEFLGKFLGAYKASRQAMNDDWMGATATAAAFVIDREVCLASAVYCPAWVIGRSVGTLIDEASRDWDANRRSINEVLTDNYFEMYEGRLDIRTLLTPSIITRLIEESDRAIETLSKARATAQRCEIDRSVDETVDSLLTSIERGTALPGQEDAVLRKMTEQANARSQINRNTLADRQTPLPRPSLGSPATQRRATPTGSDGSNAGDGGDVKRSYRKQYEDCIGRRGMPYDKWPQEQLNRICPQLLELSK